MLADIALVIGAYLLGAVPYMLLLGRAKGFDLSQEGDLHMALWRKIGRLEGLSGVLVDVLKGAIPIIIGFIFHFSLTVIASAAVAAIAGQMWPVFKRFDGERGNSTGLGIVIALPVGLTLTGSPQAWLVLLIAAIPALTGFGIRTIPRFMTPDQTVNERFMLGGPPSRSLPLGNAIGFAIAPMASWCLKQPIEMTLGLVAIFVAIMARRLTVGLRADLKTATNVKSILINRLLYDRSYL